MSQPFLSCDWGTSALRLVLAGPAGGTAVAKVEGANGIGSVHRAWQARGLADAEREAFYLAFLEDHVEELATVAGRPLAGLPLVISGMASATIGLRELAYKHLPFSLDGSDLVVATSPATREFPHPLLIISGARVPEDIMRGEETQLVGAAALEPAAADGLVILPGTHSKHLRVQDGCAVGLKTFMTGEFFDLLVHHSILAHSLDDGASLPPAEAEAALLAGVRAGAKENLLNAGFGVRVAEISGGRSRAASRHFLSGLVIGSELAGLRPLAGPGITLVGRADLTGRYERALQALGWSGPVRIVAGESAVIAGQRMIAARAGLLAAS